MDKKKIGVAVGCAAVAAVIAICAVTFGGKKGDAAEPAATVETAAAEPTSTPEVTATPAPTEAPTATPEPTAEPTATPEPTVAPTPVVTAAPQPVVTAAPQPAQQEPSSDGYDPTVDDLWTDNAGVSDEEYQAALDAWDDSVSFE